MKNNQNGFSIVGIILVFIAVVLIASIGWYVQNKQNTDTIQNVTEGSRVTYTGKIKSINLSAMATDGDGVFIIKSNGQEVTVHLSSGESACDRTAIAVPNVVVGDEVKISAEKDGYGITRICEKGTYIKL